MRLLDVHQLEPKEFSNDKTRPPYAILSHTWGDGEVSLQDIHTPAVTSMTGYAKIKKCCEVAIQDGFNYIWIDTCCIDKTSSAELSEAINSMYNWYQSADVCYTYLSDVQRGEDLSDPASSFSKSRWFTRGWTLQELLASKIIMFYDHDWVDIGTKRSLQQDISRITGIPREALLNEEKMESFSIAQRMSWAAKRETTRVEDIAYCLMGIFDVNMPTLYGEGRKAFIRLQHEIMKGSYDHSLFVWTYIGNLERYQGHEGPGIRNSKAARQVRETSHQYRRDRGSWLKSGLLSSCPRYFESSQRVRRTKGHNSTLIPPFSMTNTGLHIWLPIVRVPLPQHELYQIIFNCDLRDGDGPLTVFLERNESGQYSRIFPTFVCTAGNLEYDSEPVELYVKEDYPDDYERQQDLKRSHYQLHLPENSSSNTGYTLMGASSPQILQHKMVNFFATQISQIDIAYIIIGAKHDYQARCLVALGVRRSEDSKIFCNIYAGKKDIKEAIARIRKDEQNQFSDTLFKSLFYGIDPVILGEQTIQELPYGQRISITFRKGPESSYLKLTCNLVVEFVTPAFAQHSFVEHPV